jgi:WhiB family redox-sensing transcriptional regulator
MKDWYDQGVCRGVDPSVFYPEVDNAKTTKNAISICKSCPVRMECLIHAVQNEEYFGVWGGLSARSRMKLIRLIGSNRSSEYIINFVNSRAGKSL